MESKPLREDLERYKLKSRAITIEAIKTSTSDGVGGWTTETSQVLGIWKENLQKSSFVYKYVLEREQTTLNRILYAILVIGGIDVLLSAVSSTAQISDTALSKYIVLSLNLLGFIMSFATLVMNGRIKIYGYDVQVNLLTKQIQILENLYADVASQSALPYDMRQDAKTFISSTNNKFVEIEKNAPMISESYTAHAYKAYDLFKKNELTDKANNTIEIV